MKDLIKALHRGAVDEHRCLGCEFEDDCSIHGCRVMKKAAAKLEQLQAILADPNAVASAERQAIFRLGQMDMKQSAVQMLRDTANATVYPSRSVLLVASDMVAGLHVSKPNTGGDRNG